MSTLVTEPTSHDPVIEGAQLEHAISRQLDGLVEIASKAVATADSNLVAAVHDVRKALRRTRALVDLLDGEIHRRDRREIRGAIKAARKALDHAGHGVAASTLSQLSLDEPERDAARAVIDAAVTLTAEEIKHALVAGLETVTAQVAAIKSALPETLDWSQLVDRVRRLYREARRDRRAAKHGRRAFRVWRRHTAELAFQLDVLAGFAGAPASELSRELREVSEAQRPVAELLVARELVRAHRDLLEREPGDRLVGALEALLAPMMKSARKAGRDAFRRRPRELRRQLDSARHPVQHD